LFQIRPLLVIVALLAGAPLPGFAQDGDPGAYLAARQAAAASDYVAAASWFTRALVADPDNLRLLEGAIVGQIAAGQVATAIPIAQRLAATGATSQSAAVVLMADQAQRAAWDELLAATAGDGSLGALTEGLVKAWAELGAGQMSQALEGFDKIAANPGMEAFGLYHKALAMASAGDFEGADKILSGKAGGVIGVMRRGVIAYAQILSQLERNPDALALLDRSFGTEPDPAIAAIRERLVANETLAFDVVRNPTDGVAEVFFTMASALSGEASDGSTLVFARIAAFLRPDHTDAVLLAAGLLANQKQYALATAAYAGITPDNPSYLEAEIGRVQALSAAGNTAAAIEALQQLARTKGELLAVNLSLGDLYRKEARFEDAVLAYDRAIAAVAAPEARHWSLFYSRGIGHEMLKRFDLADADFRRALELNPGQPQVLNNLGYSMVERNLNLDEALDLIRRAVAAQPDSGYIVDSLAWALFKLGRYEDAVMPMERASILQPVDPILTDHLGDVYWAVGRKLEAEFQWQRALSFDPEDDLANRLRRKLEVGLDAVLAEEGAPSLVERKLGAVTDGD